MCAGIMLVDRGHSAYLMKLMNVILICNNILAETDWFAIYLSDLKHVLEEFSNNCRIQEIFGNNETGWKKDGWRKV